MFHPRLRAVETTERLQAKVSAPAMVRKPPEIFVLTFIMRRSALAQIVGEGDLGKSWKEGEDVVPELVQPVQQIVSGAAAFGHARSAARLSGGARDETRARA